MSGGAMGDAGITLILSLFVWREEQEQEQHEDQPMVTPREAPTMASDVESILLPLPEPESVHQLGTHAEEDEGRSVNVGEASSFTTHKGSVLPGGAGKALAEVSSLFFCVDCGSDCSTQAHGYILP